MSGAGSRDANDIADACATVGLIATLVFVASVTSFVTPEIPCEAADADDSDLRECQFSAILAVVIALSGYGTVVMGLMVYHLKRLNAETDHGVMDYWENSGRVYFIRALAFVSTMASVMLYLGALAFYAFEVIGSSASGVIISVSCGCVCCSYCCLRMKFEGFLGCTGKQAEVIPSKARAARPAALERNENDHEQKNVIEREEVQKNSAQNPSEIEPLKSTERGNEEGKVEIEVEP